MSIKIYLFFVSTAENLKAKTKKTQAGILTITLENLQQKTYLIILKINLINKIVKILFMYVASDTLGFNRKSRES